MGEERGERSVAADHEDSTVDEPTENSSLEPTGGPRRVVSGESVDDVVASLTSTKTEETETEGETEIGAGARTDRTDANADTQPSSDGSSSGSSSEADASASRSPSGPTDESTPGMVDLEDLSADAGPLAGRLQAGFGTDLTSSQAGGTPSVESDSATTTGDGSPAGSDVEEPDRDRVDGSTRADDSDTVSAADTGVTDNTDDTDGTDDTDTTDDGQPSGLLARIKRFFIG